MRVKNVVVGGGLTGLTIAERLASAGESVLVIEKRDHIGGNCHDFFDADNCYVQKYGPHLFHTSHKDVWQYLSQFTDWHPYEHRVFGHIKGQIIPIPFNLDSIDLSFEAEKAVIFKKKLEENHGHGSRISIFDLLNSKDEHLKELGEYIFQYVFINYTIKQWDIHPDDLDRSVLNRVPVAITRTNKYFSDTYEAMPKQGFSAIFKKMIANPNIKVMLNKDYKDVISSTSYDRLFYTGPLDYFFDYKFGKLKYRNIDYAFEKHDSPYHEHADVTVLNFPNDNNYTRISEFNKFLGIKTKKTVIVKEYPSWTKGTMAYPVQNTDNQKLVTKYMEEAKKLKNVVFAGRLAECKYYNMDQAVKRALDICSEL
jgi:UDP-galactopyranose mutase